MEADHRSANQAEGPPPCVRRDRPDRAPRVLVLDRRTARARGGSRDLGGVGIIRAGIGALDQIYETTDSRPFWIRFPLSWGLAVLVLAAMLGAIAIVWAGHVSGSWSIPVLILRWPAAAALVAFAFELIVRWGPVEHRRVRWASLGSVLVVVGWIGQTLIFGAYVRGVANFRTSVGSLEVFIFLATYFYIAAIILLVAMELDELVRADMERPRNRQKLLPLVTAVIRG